MDNKYVKRATQLIATAVVMLNLTGCATDSSSPAHSSTQVYPLPSDGWKPGMPETGVILTGTFEAALTAQGACAWLGPAKYVTLWPAGYGVRFHPTELIGAEGQVLAKAGEYVGFEGGHLPSGESVSQRCGPADKDALMLQGKS